MEDKQKKLNGFRQMLQLEERADATIAKYTHDVEKFLEYAGRKPITRELVIGFKGWLTEQNYSPRSINSMLASLNKYLAYAGCSKCRARNLKLQPRPYLAEEKELSREEYLRLLRAAGQDTRLQLLLESICSTGIRVSELRYFTVEAVRKGEIEIRCKGKIRVILVPGRLREKLLSYCKKSGIGEGIIFRTRGGKPINRSNIWAQMKALCDKAQVDRRKVYPHNLRKLFARCFYQNRRDLAKLADVLGHSSIDTTRIYIMETGREHRKIIEKLELVI